MIKIIDRGAALSLGGSVLAAAAAASVRPTAATDSEPVSAGSFGTGGTRGLVEAAPSFAELFPLTRYFEVDSEIAGARYSASVTVPMQYEADETQRYPVVYQIDGNLYFAATAPFHMPGQFDVMSPLRPFIMVSIGYSREESHAWDWLRVRDLVPPGEVVPDLFHQTLDGNVAVGLVSEDDAQRYRTLLANPAADKFLGFLEQELHPLLTANYRIDESDIGIWGFSYGGLFTSYVMLEGSDLFKRVCAGSPGIMGESQIFKLYDDAFASGRDFSGRQLHVTIGAREAADPGVYQWLTARGTGELLAQTSLQPLPGLQVSSEIIPLETHLTGGVPAWFSFLRACYGRS
ncbi:alpha/beta hydrolase [Mesobaculum littorinae]|uniref:Alpha/beta hydrolase n=1 Tax=Mesobaculum littorinae TaxID=2486419 RepID=A0A438ACU2_9RHOB|nr:alpha/beta hydrolase-fold protein [Mesobaculum littorinae]RVV96505.1 alpha/beta hydrolase [Mesobaculum littorinae]